MVSTIAPMHSPFSQPPQKKQKMSITQTYFLAHTARGKLAKEASRADHDLRLLVGHANLLDDLMLDLANAEREQENWFNRTVSGAKAAEEEQKPAKHIQWADAVVERPEEDWQIDDANSSDSDSDDEEMEEPYTATAISFTKSEVTTTTVTTRELTEEYDEDEHSEELALTRTQSHPHHPPELTSDSEEDSDDDSMPPSPPSTSLEFTGQQKQVIVSTRLFEKTPALDHQLSETEQSHFIEDGFYIPAREQPPMITAY